MGSLLIIGGTGVLSGAVVREAIKKGFEVTIINRGRRKLPEGATLLQSDRKKYEYIKKCLKGNYFDAVIDFLCSGKEDVQKSYNLYRNFTQQYFFISSCAVYNTSLGQICKEDSPKILQVWPYSVRKYAGEQTLRDLANNQQCHYTIIRPCVTYDDTRIPYGISPRYGYHWTLCARALAGKPLIRWNGGKNRCNMMRVEDFAIGVVGLIGNPQAYNEAFNICGDETPSFNDVLNAIENNIKCKIPVVDISSEFYAKELPERAGEILGGRSIDAINSNEKIKKVVSSFHQTIMLKEGIAKTISAYKEQNYQKGIDWKFDACCDRIIKKWCKQKKIETNGLNLHFVDYLNSATKKNRIEYELELYKNTIPIKLMNLVIRAFKKIVRSFNLF